MVDLGLEPCGISVELILKENIVCIIWGQVLWICLRLGIFFFALASLRNKKVLLPAFRGNQVSGEDTPESVCCA